MKIVTWNCRSGGFRHKASLIAAMRPDLAVIPESEPLTPLAVFSGQQPTFRTWTPNEKFHGTGLGLVGYGDRLKLRGVDLANTPACFRRYEATYAAAAVNVVAVWADRHGRQAHTGLRTHADWLQRRPSILVGDFNSSAAIRGRRWSALADLMAGLGLVSAYHHFTGETPGAESRPTLFWRSKARATYHIDYVWLPAAWADRIVDVTVGDFRDWIRHSDHAPLVVTLTDTPTGSATA